MKNLLILFNVILFALPSAAQEQIKKPEQKANQNTADEALLDSILTLSKEADDHILTVAQVKPEFPGGQDAMFAYIQQNVKYPKKERKAGLMGTVYVTFVIEKDGSLTGIRVLRGVKDAPGLDKESIRLVSEMPKWKPGTQDGKAVRVQFVLPIKYTLKDK